MIVLICYIFFKCFFFLISLLCGGFKKTMHSADGSTGLFFEVGACLTVRAKRSFIIDGPASTSRQLQLGIDLISATLESKLE